MRVPLLMTLVAMCLVANGMRFVENCPHGMVLRRDICIPWVHYEEFTGKEYDKPKFVEEPCDCVPFYQCSYQHIQEKQSKCKPTEVCCNRGTPVEEACGWGVSGAESATEAEYEQFPWMVAIQFAPLNVTVTANETLNWTRDEFIGGGSIIHPLVVLTAAHKIKRKPAHMLICRAGERRRTATEPHEPQDRLVKHIILHVGYKKQYMANDVALLVLKEPFDLTQPAVRPVCLGKGKPDRCYECFATAWGHSQFNNSEQNADKVKKVQVDMVSRGVCWRALQAVDDARRKKRGLEPLNRRELHSSLLCAGGEGQDTCVGDGGSPLVCRLQMNGTHARFAVFGMAAWGVGCGERGAPGVYVNVGEAYAWILANIKDL